MKLTRIAIAILICGITSSVFAQQHFGNNKGGRDDRGGNGGWQRDWDKGGGWQDDNDDKDDVFDRPEHNVGNADRIGAVNITRGRAYQILNINREIGQLKLCVRRDDLHLIRLDIALMNANGRTLTLAANDYIQKGTCTQWFDLPGVEQKVSQIVVVGNSDRDNRNPRVVVFEKVKNRNPNPGGGGRVWSSPSNQTSCGDSQGPFFKDARNNQIHIMPCPNQNPNGGPIGMNCNVARGTLCYGWRYPAQPGFYCEAPRGKYPPNPAYIYSIYQCL